jgi:hypothetical protein
LILSDRIGHSRKPCGRRSAGLRRRSLSWQVGWRTSSIVSPNNYVIDYTEQDCIDFIVNLVIRRTFDGYMTEKQTIYGQLQDIIKVKIEPAPDEWDRLYNVDFSIKIKDKYIGLQIKPIGGVSHITQIYQERTQQAKTHEKFTAKFGGKVFYVISIKVGDKKQIHNTEVIEEIKAEIKRLQS